MTEYPIGSSPALDDVDHAGQVVSGRIPPVEPIQFPDGWTLSTSWTRAQSEEGHHGPSGPAEFRVLLGDGDAHRVIFCILDGDLRAECNCKGFEHRQFCAHVAYLWWSWVRGQVGVVDLDTGRTHVEPPTWLRLDDRQAPEPQHKRAAADGGIRQ